MIEQPADFIDLLDSEALTDECIELSLDQIDQAAQLSRSIPQSAQQWQTYIHILALFAVKQWLSEWAPDLPIDDSRCSTLQPPYASVIEAVCHLSVGPFNLCLLAAPLGEAIDLPKAVVDLPQFAPHLYVLVEVKEEQMQAQLYGYLDGDQLLEQLPAHAPTPTSSWTHTVPLRWFNPEPAALLGALRCLPPGPLRRAPEAAPSLQTVQHLQARLQSLLPQLRSPHSVLSQLLSWEEAAVLLSQPELVQWLYRVQTAPELPAAPAVVQDGRQEPAARDLRHQPAIDVGYWLSDRLDAVAHNLRWTLIPPFAPASALRSAQDDLRTVGVQIPSEARGARYDLQLGQTALRLSAFTWVLSPAIESFEWTLLLIVGEQSGSRLPIGTRLQIRDPMQVLFDQTLTAEEDANLYSQVGGGIMDQFWVTITLADGATIALPPFVFNPVSTHSDL